MSTEGLEVPARSFGLSSWIPGPPSLNRQQRCANRKTWTEKHQAHQPGSEGYRGHACRYGSSWEECQQEYKLQDKRRTILGHSSKESREKGTDGFDGFTSRWNSGGREWKYCSVMVKAVPEGIMDGTPRGRNAGQIIQTGIWLGKKNIEQTATADGFLSYNIRKGKSAL